MQSCRNICLAGIQVNACLDCEVGSQEFAILFKIKYAVDVWLCAWVGGQLRGARLSSRVTYMIQSSEDPDLLVNFIHLVFLLSLYGLASHLAMILSIKREMDSSKAPAPKAMRCDCVFPNQLIPVLEGSSLVNSMTTPFERSRLEESVQIYAPSPWAPRRRIRTGTLERHKNNGERA